jgi:hypothetical protein
MKRLFITLLLACAAVVAFAQNPILRQRMEIAEIETGEDNIHLQVFYMDDESPRVYYLSLGDLGIGGDIVQVHFDPVYELFIPLGNTLDEAIDKMKDIQDYYKQPRLWSTEITGNFAVAYPSQDPITVTVTSRRLLTTRLLEFSIPADDLVRATHISRSDFTSMLNAVKLYRKIHPNEK